MKTVRKLLDNSRAVDAVVVVVIACFTFSAYLDAYAHVKVPGRVLLQAEAAGLAGLTASWFVFTGFLFFLFGRGLRRGRPWNRALPDGYTGSLVAALVFGAALITDNYWPHSNDTLGLDILFTPQTSSRSPQRLSWSAARSVRRRAAATAPPERSRSFQPRYCSQCSRSQPSSFTR